MHEEYHKVVLPINQFQATTIRLPADGGYEIHISCKEPPVLGDKS